MSFPPGTEMFQFPGFASPHYGFMRRYPKGVGCPIRTSTDQSLLAAPRGFSQRATSFIASWCQGIHRMPFLYSISQAPPAKANLGGRDPSCTETILRVCRRLSVAGCQKQPPPSPPAPAGSLRGNIASLRTQQDSLRWPLRRSLARSTRALHPTKSFTTPLNPRRRPLGCCSREQRFPVRHPTGRRDLDQPERIDPDHTRPETHQNLIYISKEQHDRQGGRSNGMTTHPGRCAQADDQTEFRHSAILGTVASCSSSVFRSSSVFGKTI